MALAAGGCSADVARFDSPSFNLTGGASTNGPKPPEAARSSGLGDAGSSGYTPPPRRDSGVQIAALPEAQRPASTLPPPSAPVTQAATPSSRRPAAVAAAPAAPAARGEQIEVQQGDTLFGLSKKHHVSLNELMQVNGLTSPSLKPGQKLTLPVARSRTGKPLIKAPTTAAGTPAAAPAVAAAPAADTAGWNGSYTVKAGDSLYAVSRQHKVKLTELQRVNGITDVRKVRPGTVLKVPGGAAGLPAPAVAEASAPPLAPRVTSTRTEPVAAAPSSPSQQPTMINGETKVAALTDRASDAAPAADAADKSEKVAAAAPAAAATSGKLRWPVKGKIIAGFGPRPDGTHNDGVNLSVPQGTEVHAADAGTVAYSGSELKGYGNLVLVRHDNGWVTAYAHNEELLVKRGDRVKRGQLIAKAGKSGQVDQPQVHFELRQGSKPVDPTQYMERL